MELFSLLISLLHMIQHRVGVRAQVFDALKLTERDNDCVLRLQSGSLAIGVRVLGAASRSC